MDITSNNDIQLDSHDIIMLFSNYKLHVYSLA